MSKWVEAVDTAYLVAKAEAPRLAEIAAAVHGETHRILSSQRVICKEWQIEPDPEAIRRAVCFDVAAAMLTRIAEAVDKWPPDIKATIAGIGSLEQIGRAPFAKSKK